MKFSKDSTINGPEKQSTCIANGCSCFPVKGFGFGGPLLLCSFHPEEGRGKVWDGITARINMNQGLISHYFDHLRNKTPIDMEIAAGEQGHHPGIVGHGAMAAWNKRDDENWQEYKGRYWGMLTNLIVANKTTKQVRQVA